jgi:hypothetical protein
VLAAHFCGHQASTTLEPNNLVRNLAYTLAQHIPAFGDVLMEPHRQEELDKLARDVRGDLPVDDLSRVVLSPLRELPNPLPAGAAPAWLVLDALDEAVEYARAREVASILDLLVAELPIVPPWLRVLATSRSGEVPSQLGKVVRDGYCLVHRIHITGDQSRDDISSYIEERTKRATTPLTGHDKALIVERSAGNFLCAKLILDGLLADSYDMAHIDRLPPGLDGFYAAEFRRLYPGKAELYAKAARFLFAVMVAAQDDLSLDTLAHATALPSAELLTETRRLAAYLLVRKGRYSVFHKSLSDWLREPDSAEAFAIDESEGHAALAGLCLKKFDELRRARVRGLRGLKGDETAEYLMRFGVDHLVAAAHFAEAVDLLNFVTQMAQYEQQQPTRPATEEVKKFIADVVPGRFKRRVLRGLKNCREEDKGKIDPLLLGGLLVDFYQIEPLEAPLKILLHHHAALWSGAKGLQETFLAADNYVLRYAISEAIADACLDGDPLWSVEKIYSYLRDENFNTRELGAYALRHIYGERPDLIQSEYLELVGDSDTYASRSALGDLMLTLKFQREPGLPELRSQRFWEPIWSHNWLDVFDLKAADAFLEGAGRTPDDAEVGTRKAYDDFVATEIFRANLEDMLIAEPGTDFRILTLVSRDGFESLARDPKQIGRAEEALRDSPHLLALMRLFFSHPLWEVAENAASSLAAFAERDFQKREIVSALFEDSYWRVCFGAIETAYQLVDFDRMTLFREALTAKRFYEHPNSRVRALCAENLIAYMLDCPQDVRARYLEEFDAAVRRWIADDDAWVLEHALRLLKRIDREPSGCARYFERTVPYLFQGLPAPLPYSGWNALSRADFLTHIEKRQRERAKQPITPPG